MVELNNQRMEVRRSGFNSEAVENILSSINSLWLDGKALLMVGARGTGKDHIVHQLASAWGRSNIQKIDCAQDGSTLCKSLVGYVDHIKAEVAYDPDEAIVRGAIDDASEGILYLDRIDLAPPDSIETLVSVLENRPFVHLGGDQLVNPNDVRVIASCIPHPFSPFPISHLHEDLQAAFGNRTVEIPKLTNRTDEIIPALALFLEEEGKLSDFMNHFHSDADWQAVLVDHSWTHNFYELRELAQRLFRNFRDGITIDKPYLQRCLLEIAESKSNSSEHALQARCVRYASAITYHGEALNPTRLFEWIQQFTPFSSGGTVDPRDFAEELVQHINSLYFYSNQRLKGILQDKVLQLEELIRSDDALCERLGDKHDRYRRNIVVTSPLGPMKSPSVMQQLMRECSLLSPTNACEFTDLESRLAHAGKPCIVLFVDDFTGSGQQGQKIIDFLSASSGIQQAVENCADVLFVSIICVAYKRGVDRISSSVNSAPDWLKTRFHLLVGDLLSERDQVFHETSHVFPEEAVRNMAFNLIVESIGSTLYQKWPDGYEHLQSLVIFEHNIPNNTLPVLWKDGSGRFQWRPIFPRSR